MNNIRRESFRRKLYRGTAGWTVTRRDLLKASGLFITGFSVFPSFVRAGTKDQTTKIRFGMATDVHYADTAARGRRHYRESRAKLKECVELMNNRKVAFLVELGDFKDENSPAGEKSTLKNLKTIESVFGKFKGKRYHVLGNHDVDSISKRQFLDRVENSGISKKLKYYSFDSRGVHFIVLDANYKSDGTGYDHGNFNWTDTNIPQKELTWLTKDLESAARPSIVFIHQQLDGTGAHTVKNAARVRTILEESRKVIAVFQGHNHAGHYSRTDNVHYYTLKAMVEGSGETNSSYAVVEVFDNNDIAVTGYRKAVDYNADAAKRT